MLDREVVRVALFQFIEHEVNGIFESLVILSGLRSVDQFEQGSEVFLVFWRFVPDIADEGGIVELFCLDPEILPGLIAISLRVDDDRIDQFEDVFFAADVGERVVVHGFSEVDRIQRLDDITVFLKHLSAFDQHCTLGISDHIGAVHLHQVGLHEEAGLTRAGTTDDKDVLIPRVLRLLRTAVHGQPFGLGENDIVGKVIIHVRPDVFRSSPTR